MRLALLGVALVAACAAWAWRGARLSRQSARRALRLALLNPRDGSLYNDAAVVMFTELFRMLGFQIQLCEVDVCRDEEVERLMRSLDDFQGFLLCGSVASVYDKTAWVTRTASICKRLLSSQRPVLGICFGHQMMAHALGGEVAKNSLGLQAAACNFELTPLGCSLLEKPSGEACLLYHHSDIVKALPARASNLGCSRENPVHAAAYFTSPTAARMAGARFPQPLC